MKITVKMIESECMFWLRELCYRVSDARATTAVTDSCRADRWLQVTGETRVHLYLYNPTNWLHANYKLISNRLNHRDQLFDASVISCTIMYWALLSIDCISIWQVLINGVISIQDSQVSAAQVLCNKVAVYLLHQQAGASTSTCTGASTSTCCSVLSTESQ